MNAILSSYFVFFSGRFLFVPGRRMRSAGNILRRIFRSRCRGCRPLRNSPANGQKTQKIDEWIIDSLRNMGCDTAKSVLAYTAEEIATRADLEIETVHEIIEIFKAEFEDDDQ